MGQNGRRSNARLFIKLSALSGTEPNYDLYTVVTKLKRNNWRLRSFFEIEMLLWRRRQSFRFILVTTVYITNSSFCHVFVTNAALVTFQEFENNQEYMLKHNFIIIEYHNFWWMIKLGFWNVFQFWKSVK